MKTVTKIIADNMAEGLRIARDQIGPDAMIVKTLNRRGRIELFVEYESMQDDRDDQYDQYDQYDKVSLGPKNGLDSYDGAQGRRSLIQEARISNKETADDDRKGHGRRTSEAYHRARIKMLSAVVATEETSVQVSIPATSGEDKGASSGNKRTSGENNRSGDDSSVFDAILRNVTDRDHAGSEVELTPRGLIEDLQLNPSISAQLLDCRRIDEVISRLQNMITVADGESVKSGFQAFVGPAGGGKTTTLVKLMTLQVKKFGPDSTAIIGCDNYRAGAMQQLGKIAKLLGVPFLRVGVDYSLEEAVAKTAKRQFVAIDMPGLGLNDPDLLFELDKLEQVNADISRLLVLPAYLQADVMDLVLERYSGSAVSTRLVLSRLDECCTLGPALSLVIKSGIPVAYTTDGPHIPEDVQVANSVDLVREAMKLLRCQVAKERNADFTNKRNETVSQL
jgi:flagellar biosynthesis GTPase FlhF